MSYYKNPNLIYCEDLIMKIKFLPYGLCGIMLSGCYTSAYYQTEHSPHNEVSKNVPLKVFTASESVEYQKVARLITNSLVKNGYQVNGVNTDK